MNQRLDLELTGKQSCATSVVWKPLSLVRVILKETTTRNILVEKMEVLNIQRLLTLKKPFYFKSEGYTTFEDLKELGEQCQ
jgi:hypothetical protein